MKLFDIEFHNLNIQLLKCDIHCASVKSKLYLVTWLQVIKLFCLQFSSKRNHYHYSTLSNHESIFNLTPPAINCARLCVFSAVCAVCNQFPIFWIGCSREALQLTHRVVNFPETEWNAVRGNAWKTWWDCKALLNDKVDSQRTSIYLVFKLIKWIPRPQQIFRVRSHSNVCWNHFRSICYLLIYLVVC